MNANVAPAAPAPEPSNGKRRKVLLLIALIFIVLGALWAAYWVLVLAKREQTDDAYVNGNKVVISAQVSGTVIAVLADDTQLVKAGQVLVRLDPIDAQTSLSRTASALAQTVRQVRQEKATADQYDSVIETRKLELARAEADLAKREPLVADACHRAGRSAARPRERRLGARRLDPGGAPVDFLARLGRRHAGGGQSGGAAGQGGLSAMRGSPRSAMPWWPRSPATWRSAACNWASTSRRDRRS